MGDALGRAWLRLALVVGLVLAAAGGCWRGGEAARGAPDRQANVLLITLDTTRADCLGCYGHPVVKTPNIDGLAREGVRFGQCTTAAPITLPAHTSIMTGTYPFVHRARNNGRFVADEGNVTLAETLQAAGWRTGAEVAAFVLDAAWGLDQGFESYRSSKAATERGGRRFEQWAESQSVPADDVGDRAVEWLAGHVAERFFLWVHFFDPHQPCAPPERFKQQYDDPYLGEIAFVDEQIGRLLAEVRRLGLDRRTLVVVVGDHGEGRGEHRELTHTYFVYDTTMSVPLVVWGPGRVPAGRVVDAQVRTVDIVPTVLDLLGLPPKEDAQGASLRPMIDGKPGQAGLAAYGESVSAAEAFGYARLWCWRAEGWKYIHAPKPELYDMQIDPGEEINLAGRYPERVEAMKAALESFIAEAGRKVTDRAAELDAGAVRRLAALGYVGGYAPQEAADEIELFRRPAGADPKDHVERYVQFITAQAYAEAGQPEKAVGILQELAVAEPDSPAVRDYLAGQLAAMKRYEAAAGQYRELLRLQPDSGLTRFRLGKVLGELGQYTEGVQHLRQAAATMPEYADAQAFLGFGLLRTGQTEEAEACFRRVLEREPANETAGLELAGLRYGRREYGEALRLLREGLRLNPDSVQMANNLAWYLATLPEEGLRDGAEAVRLAEQVKQRAGSDDPSVLDTLAAAYAEAGRFGEAVETARRALELATAGQATELAGQLRGRLALYEAGQAYHEE